MKAIPAAIMKLEFEAHVAESNLSGVGRRKGKVRSDFATIADPLVISDSSTRPSR
jgi:hypothetical protein